MPKTAPGFSFAAGNAQKLLALPLYALGALASIVVPRRRGLWVFGCGSGIGEGSLELFRHAREQDPSIDAWWLARDDRELAQAQSLGFPAAVKSSARGFWLTLRAEVVAITHGFGDANRYATRGAFVVQLWHGIPLKLINLDSPVTMRSGILPNSAVLRRFLRFAYRRGADQIRLFPAASELSASRLRTAFGLPADRVVVTGDPRDDVLLRGTESERRASATALVERRLGVPIGRRRIILYAPTWRDGDADPGVPTPAQWSRLHDWLEGSESVLLVRPHPHGYGDYAAGITGSDRIHLLGANLQSDVTPVLPAIDALITDYSSIAFDFALTGRPIHFFAPDVAEYSATRGLYEPYAGVSGGTESLTWDEVIDALERADADAAWATRLREHSEALALRHHAYRDGRNTVRVYAETVSRLKERQ